METFTFVNSPKSTHFRRKNVETPSLHETLKEKLKRNEGKLFLVWAVLEAFCLTFYNYKVAIGFFVASLLIASSLLSCFDVDTQKKWTLVRKHWHFSFLPLSVLTFFVIIIMATLLHSMGGVMTWGWWKLLTGVDGSAISSTYGTGTPLWLKLSPCLIYPLIIFNVPKYAFTEEMEHRLGCEKFTLWQHTKGCLKFGLLHLVMGISLGTALALSLGGVAFTLVYLFYFKKTAVKQKAVCYATSFHATYNLIVFGVVLGSLSYMLFQ